MSRIRTLPVTFAPNPGEALDSWLEALAAHTHTHYGDLLAAVGLLPAGAGIAENRWTFTLSGDELTAVARATRTDPHDLAAMTLRRYDGIAMRLTTRGRIQRATLWGRANGSRYCPRCLAETGGRWPLRWRLGWSFACTLHARLLADHCPTCRRVPRDRPHLIGHIPQPGHCAGARTGTAGGTTCGTDLTATATPVLAADHPALYAQQVLDATIEADRAAFGIYRHDPQPATGLLNDIRALAHQIQRLNHTPEGLQDLRVQASHETTQPVRPALWRPPTATATAYAVTAAMTILDTDPDRAADAIVDLIGTARGRGNVTTITTVGAWSKDMSPVLRRLQAAALAPTMRQLDRIRHSPPAIAWPATATLDSRGSSLPTLIWPSWYLHLSTPPPRARHTAHRAAMSCAALLAGTGATKTGAIDRLASPITTRALSWSLGLLHASGHWDNIHAAFSRAAAAIDDDLCPIDYDRRRALDYTDLLTATEWRAIHDDLDRPTPPTLRSVAAAHLYEKLSTRPASTYPHYTGPPLAPRLTKLVPLLDADLAPHLNAAAEAFLTRHEITDEPLTWSPPINLLAGLDLPGCRREIDLDRLHQLISIDQRTVHQAAKELGTNAAVVTHTLTLHPPPKATPRASPRTVPTTGRSAPTSGGNDGTLRRRLLRDLPVDELARLYQTEHLSLATIATRHGCSRQTLTRLAREYGIPLRPPQKPPTHPPPERDWLYEQYVTHQRTLPDLAKELGVSTMKVNVWAHQLNIPLRPRGGASHASALAR